MFRRAWIMREKSLATLGSISSSRVITGKAMAPPPSLVAPATVAPSTMVSGSS